jgi:hypothetical protein
MMWLTWRQFRAHAVTAVAALAAFAVLLAVTGPHLASLYATSGIAGCHGDSCGQLATNFLSLLGAGGYPVVYMLGIAGIALAPAIIGIFWGAPLIAREFETGTFRLSWTQSVTRTRWLASKLALPGLAALAVTEALSLMQSWWAAPIGHAARLATNSIFPLGMGPFSLLAFDAHGITPIGYAAFAFTLGVTTGVILRRTVLAMAVTLAIFAIVQVAMPLGIRPHLFPPDHTTTTVGSFNGATQIGPNATFGFAVAHLPSRPGAWILSSGAVNAAGQPVTTIPADCRQEALNGSEDWPNCMTNQGIRIAVTYQPTSRYWPIQFIETAIYLALALALGGYCFRRLGRRLS